MTIETDFRALTTHAPLAWQRRLYEEDFAKGGVPAAIDVPTGLGKTLVMALWLIARAHGKPLPRRLVYVVDRRAVVDQATDEAIKLREALEGEAKHLKASLGLEGALPISTLRGQFVDNKEWLVDPAAPAIIVGTVDMIGSRLLFEGYGVSRRMRPYHAGFLGVDTLVVLDEAHLVPPFAHLLRAIETDPALWPQDAADRALLPPFKLLPLSATQRGQAQAQQPPFRLETRDSDEITNRRLRASKTLRFETLPEKEYEAALAKEALRLATKGGFKRVVVFCDKRSKSNEENKEKTPSAEGVEDQLKKLVGVDKETKELNAHIELLVGARRVRERERAKEELRALGFIGDRIELKKPAFLIATAAGEVGVDIDADHMVCDLVPWERMVQRLGRVNRRGEGAAEVIVFDTSALEKNDERKARLENTRALLEQAENLSPGALRALQTRAGAEWIDAASSPKPLRPALNRALVDAWSMTSLEQHAGRPEIAPWLRGWEENPQPQTTLVWRKYLPVRANEQGPATAPGKKEIEDFFEAAPPHESEKLETETFRVVEWLKARAEAVLKGASPTRDDESIEADASTASPETRSDEIVRETSTALFKPKHEDIAAFVFSARGDYEGRYTFRELAQDRDSNARKAFERNLADRTLVLDARLGGLSDKGMLDGKASAPARAADDGDFWMNPIPDKRKPGREEPVIKFRIEEQALDDSDWKKSRKPFLREAADDDVNADCLHFFKWRAESLTGESLSILRTSQSLAKHSEWVKNEARGIADALRLPDAFKSMLCRAAYLHDQGKARERWQRAMGAPAGGEPFAKTDGRGGNLALLKIGEDIFRHEFASLIDAEKPGALDEVGADLRDLALHLIVAHHGFARPVIFAFDPESATSETEIVARAVALRFARLQKRWGPWGLAWWEALLRAADHRASRALEETSSKEGR